MRTASPQLWEMLAGWVFFFVECSVQLTFDQQQNVTCRKSLTLSWMLLLCYGITPWCSALLVNYVTPHSQGASCSEAACTFSCSTCCNSTVSELSASFELTQIQFSACDALTSAGHWQASLPCCCWTSDSVCTVSWISLFVDMRPHRKAYLASLTV